MFSGNNATNYVLYATSPTSYFDEYNSVTQLLNTNNLPVYGNSWFFITGSYGTSLDTNTDLNGIFTYCNQQVQNTPVFFYNNDNYTIDNPYSELYTALDSKYHTNSVEFLMSEFINNADLETYYNNWYGACNVTYKMVENNQNGWMINMWDEDTYQHIRSWQVA